MANPNTDLVILQALAAILPVGTRLLALNPITPTAPYGSTVYIQDDFSMAQGAFPALQLYADTQSYTRNSQLSYDGGAQFHAEYCDRWDTQPNTIKAIRDAIAADLEIMKSNVGKNEALVVNGVEHATSVPKLTLSGYHGMLDSSIAPGLTVVKRELVIYVNILPYDET
ncbi:MAG TPA: hypothetical protein VFA10_17770 [Ktedonobacteraceae bacterium]|nr:hypothetical protein [Ktedonobacteraceae bacterium]